MAVIVGFHSDGSDRQPRLLPLLESGLEDSPDTVLTVVVGLVVVVVIVVVERQSGHSGHDAGSRRRGRAVV